MASRSRSRSRHSSYSTLEVEVKAPDLGSPSPNPTPTPVELIGMVFTYQLNWRRSRFDENGRHTIEWQRQGLRVPFIDLQLSVDVFERANDSLSAYISLSFAGYEELLDAEIVAYRIKCEWLRIRDQVTANSSHKVCSLTVNLIQWEIELRDETPAIGMVPASEGAIEEMLEEVKVEEGDCAVCLDEFRKGGLKKMPCSHIFHGQCIENWLRKSHCCPVCRFSLPTDPDLE